MSTQYYNFSTGLISHEEAQVFTSYMAKNGIQTGKKVYAKVYARNEGYVRVPFTVSGEQMREHSSFIKRYTRKENGLDKNGLDMRKMGE